MWERAVTGDHRDVTLFLKQMRKQYDSCAKNSVSQDQTLSSLTQRICITYQSSCGEESNSQTSGFVIGSRSHPREEGSYTETLHRKKIPPAKQKVNIQKLTWLHPAMLISPWRRSLTALSCHTIHQDIQIIVVNISLKLSFLQKTRPSPEYWFTI